MASLVKSLLQKILSRGVETLPELILKEIGGDIYQGRLYNTSPKKDPFGNSSKLACYQIIVIIPQKINISPKKGPFQKESSLPTITFRGHVAFRRSDSPRYISPGVHIPATKVPITFLTWFIQAVRVIQFYSPSCRTKCR